MADENDTDALDPDQMEAAKNEATLDEIETDLIRGMSIYERIARISSELSYVQKGSTIKGKAKSGGEFSYQGVSHDDVTRELQPYFKSYMIHAFPTVVEHRYNEAKQMTELTLDVMFRCLDQKEPPRYNVVTDETLGFGGEYTTRVIGYGQDYGDKGVGKAYSYGMKYALLKVFFLETGEDDEQRVTDIELATITASQYRDIMFKVVDLKVDEQMFVKALNQRILKESIEDLIELPLRNYEGAMALLRKKEDEINKAKGEGEIDESDD